MFLLLLSLQLRLNLLERHHLRATHLVLGVVRDRLHEARDTAAPTLGFPQGGGPSRGKPQTPLNNGTIRMEN